MVDYDLTACVLWIEKNFNAIKNDWDIDFIACLAEDIKNLVNTTSEIQKLDESFLTTLERLTPTLTMKVNEVKGLSNIGDYR